MKLIIAILLSILFLTSCSISRPKNVSNSIYLLTNNSSKMWFPHFTGTKEIVGECWEFNIDSTFCYYNYDRENKKTTLIQYRGDDIKIGDNGKVKWRLDVNYNLLFIDGSSYIIKKITLDSLLIFDPLKGYGPDILLFSAH